MQRIEIEKEHTIIRAFNYFVILTVVIILVLIVLICSSNYFN